MHPTNRNVGYLSAALCLFVAACNSGTGIGDSRGSSEGDLTAPTKQLTLAGARAAISAAVAEAKERGTTGTIAVADSAGRLIALYRVDGTFVAGDAVSSGKARTAALFRKPTRVFEEIIVQGRTPMLKIDGFTPMQGGVPIVVAGNVVGAIGVSGAASAAQDEELALAGAAVLAGETDQDGG